MSTQIRKAKGTGFTFLPMLLIAVAFVVFILQPVVSVAEDEYAIKRRFSQVVTIRDTAGPMFRVPMLDSVSSLPRNNLLYSPPPSAVLTQDKKAMEVDSYCIWKISNPMTFITNLNDIDKAQRRLDATIYNTTKNTISALTQDEILAGREGSLDDVILNASQPEMARYGIELLTVTIKLFTLPDDNLQAVYTRMISERNQIAAQYRAEGQEAANIVRNTADLDARNIVAQARAEADKLVAQGESEYMKILSDAYSGTERAEFYRFLRSIDALKVTMKGSTSVILPYDSPLGKWFVGYGETGGE